jgi:hypothetical protein
MSELYYADLQLIWRFLNNKKMPQTEANFHNSPGMDLQDNFMSAKDKVDVLWQLLMICRMIASLFLIITKCNIDVFHKTGTPNRLKIPAQEGGSNMELW